jgi:hypothetical protein
MASRPVAIGMTLCDYVIVEEKTKKVSLIGAFTGMRVSRFPSDPSPFSVYAALTDGLGGHYHRVGRCPPRHGRRGLQPPTWCPVSG